MCGVCAVCRQYTQRHVVTAGLSLHPGLMYGLADSTQPSTQIKVPLFPRQGDAAGPVNHRCVWGCEFSSWLQTQKGEMKEAKEKNKMGEPQEETRRERATLLDAGVCFLACV